MLAKPNGRVPRILRIFCIGMLLWALHPALAGSGNPSFPLLKRQEVQASPGRWISVSYRDLVDTSQITQSGETLGEVLSQIGRRPNLRGSIQPFLTPFSTLLTHVLDMNASPAGRPYVEAERQFPPGSEQPAWAAILRSGTIKVYFDGSEKARVFLPGDDPAEGYKRDYGVIRHVLAGFLPNVASSRLRVEVFAYRNDYSRLELRLNLNPYVFIADSFPAPKGKTTLDLVGLRAFFQERGKIEGGRLDPRGGLTLFASRPNPLSREESPVSMADLAVTYRAVFYAGDNTAFVSLDPHRDPTKVTVNFGGLLEDTRIGSVVLEADKRFKTITCGLDPTSMKDLRSSLRARIPSFLTSAERKLLTMPISTGGGKWEGTRFWYYPESIVVEADLDFGMAAIRKAQFTADAERRRSDFQTPEQFERFKAKSLSPAIRQNIDHLNAHYPDYAMAFSELRDLTSVARLFGIGVWLKRAKVEEVDLDILLSVVLPSCRTERERVQLVASSVIGLVEKERVDSAGVASRCRLTSHTGALNRSVEDVFGGWKGIAEYLCRIEGVAPERYGRYEQQSQRLYAEISTHPAASLVKSKRDLEAFAEFLADQIEPEVSEATRLNAAIEAQRSELNDLDKQMEILKAILDRRIDNTDTGAVEEYNSHVRAYNLLVRRYESVRVNMNADVDRYNALGLSTRRIMEIGGGVALHPDSFTVNCIAQSAALDRLGTAAKAVKSEWTRLDDGSQWIRSRSAPSASDVAPMRIGVKWVYDSQGTTGVSYSSAVGRYWFSPSGDKSQWRDQITTSDETVYRLGDPSTHTLHIATFRGGRVQSYIIGTRQDANRIVFVKSNRTDVQSPDTPPAWYRP